MGNSRLGTGPTRKYKKFWERIRRGVCTSCGSSPCSCKLSPGRKKARARWLAVSATTQAEAFRALCKRLHTVQPTNEDRQ